MSYWLNVGVALDQLGNAVLGGQADETLSARAWRTEQKGRILGRIARPLIDALLWVFQRQHCAKAYQAECQRKQLPSEYSRP